MNRPCPCPHIEISTVCGTFFHLQEQGQEKVVSGRGQHAGGYCQKQQPREHRVALLYYIKDRFVSDYSLCYHQCVPGGLYQWEGTGAFAGLCSLCYAAGGITCHCVDSRIHRDTVGWCLGGCCGGRMYYPTAAYSEKFLSLIHISRHYSTYASGGTAAVLSKQKPLSYEAQIQEFVRRVQEAECIIAVSYTHLTVRVVQKYLSGYKKETIL